MIAVAIGCLLKLKLSNKGLHYPDKRKGVLAVAAWNLINTVNNGAEIMADKEAGIVIIVNLV